jgi:transcriptional regulator with XRE-family HTH domain
MSQRFRRGNHYASVLTPAQAIDIRRKYAEGMTQSALCHEYDVSVSTIARLVRGESWRHLHAPNTIAASQARLLALLAEQGIDPPALSEAQHAAGDQHAVGEDTDIAQPIAGQPPAEPTLEDRIAAEIQRRYGLKVRS